MAADEDQTMTPASPFPTIAIPDPMVANDTEFMTPPQSPPSSSTSVPSIDDLDHFSDSPFHLPTPFITPYSFVLDFFYQATNPSTPSNTIEPYLSRSWSEDPLTTLKLVCHLRTVRRQQPAAAWTPGGTKSGNEAFYAAVLWIHAFHPKTLAHNLDTLVKFGYWKDLPEILYRILEGCDVREVQRRELEKRTENRIERQVLKQVQREHEQGGGIGNNNLRRRRRRDRNNKKSSMMSLKEKLEKKRMAKETIENKRRLRTTVIPREVRIANEKAKVEMEMIEARRIRHEKRDVAMFKATHRYYYDLNYRFLHDQISELFAGRLRLDLECLNSGELQRISLAAKWCPSLDSSYDRSTLLCHSIARRIFPEDYTGHVVRIRDRLRREVLVPLRRALELPEVFMTDNRWDELPYNRVASVAKSKYWKLFLEHDIERFRIHSRNRKSDRNKKNKRKIELTTTEEAAAAELLPYQVIENLDSVEDEAEAEVQWKRLVSDLSKVDKFKNSIAICDVRRWYVSRDQIEEVSAALALLVSDLSQDPWKGKMLVNVDYKDPKLKPIEGDSLKEKTKFIREAFSDHYGLNLSAAFDQLLETAVEAGLSKDEMVKRVFVFSGDSLDSYEGYTSSYSSWETEYAEIKRKFGEKGYGEEDVPQIVFWNLADGAVMPVKQGKNGMACLGGFCADLLKMFLGVTSPVEVIEAAIAGKEYEKLAVLD